MGRRRTVGAEYPLVYVGPRTLWGLASGTRVRRDGRRGNRSGHAGLVSVRTEDGRRWLVPPGQLEAR